MQDDPHNTSDDEGAHMNCYLPTWKEWWAAVWCTKELISYILLSCLIMFFAVIGIVSALQWVWP